MSPEARGVTLRITPFPCLTVRLSTAQQLSATSLPSGDQARHRGASFAPPPLSVAWRLPVCMSHRHTVSSLPVDATHRQSGEATRTEKKLFLPGCLKFRSSPPLAASRNSRVVVTSNWPAPPHSVGQRVLGQPTCLPSGENTGPGPGGVGWSSKSLSCWDQTCCAASTSHRLRLPSAGPLVPNPDTRRRFPSGEKPTRLTSPGPAAGPSARERAAASAPAASLRITRCWPKA